VATLDGPGESTNPERKTDSPCPKFTQLTSGAITAVDTITVELIEADETPAVIIVSWPVKPTVLQPRRFPDAAATIARLFAEAHTALAAIKAGRKL
jgi:hypothetical protein